ncbi:MAG: hypothetical protein IJV06_03600 [Bacteroidaceae bacterium]|nr:hypothetical protein [Bacteroidaceae bacterium]
MREPETKEQKFLIDGIIADLAFYLVEDNGMTVNEALNTVYNSEYYNLLNNLDTELYLRSSLNNYHYLRRELDYGKS